MKNEIYEKLKTAQKDFKEQLKLVIKEYPELLGCRVFINIELHDLPTSAMPEGSKVNSTKSHQWLAYSDDYFLPSMYSISRKIKTIVVFEDEPESSNQNTRLTDEDARLNGSCGQTVTSNQP